MVLTKRVSKQKKNFIERIFQDTLYPKSVGLSDNWNNTQIADRTKVI